MEQEEGGTTIACVDIRTYRMMNSIGTLSALLCLCRNLEATHNGIMLTLEMKVMQSLDA